MRRLFALVAGLAVGASSLALLTSPASAHADTLSDEAAFVAAANALRGSRGLAGLAVDVRLTSVARAWSTQMAVTNRLSENPNLGAQVPAGWTAIGENVGFGPSLAAVEAAFVTSPPHLANLVRPDYSGVGVGVIWSGSTVWVTEVFMAGVTPIVPTQVVAIAAMRRAVGTGYWVATRSGQVSNFGGAANYGSMAGHPLNAGMVGMGVTADSGGYWLLGADGGIFAFGDAGFYGSTGGLRLNAPVVAMAATPTGRGYWVAAADGGIFTFGDAGYYGSMGGKHLNRPIVGITASSTGRGYRLVASDGGIFTFGDARFYGSTGGIRLNRPVIGMTTDPATGGYRMVATDGGVFNFNASFYGSLGSTPLPAPITTMASTVDGNGYYLMSATGTIYCFGDAKFFGS